MFVFNRLKGLPIFAVSISVVATSDAEPVDV